ncbi:Beta-hexosaminidase [Lamellibrachia satsuma]|nr:Beta-hexosaminidase [Lamellibrachia satsuma]
METGDVIMSGTTTTTNESYFIEVDGDKPAVRIVGRDKAGVFYGVQTLISLALDKRGIPTGHISDQPRYPYRGLMLDVARNFRSKEDVLRLIDVMATYKLKKLHFHLADDEGWRLEIPGLPELTQIVSKRCHDLQEKTCTLSQLGSGPTSSGLGSGFYSQANYKEILGRATARHVDVIPEFDSPGHARAAIISMAARDSDDFLLRHPNDTSQYFSNIWEWGGGSRAYELANRGYKVVVGHATHLYFDHPYKPDPEERGFYWATRYTDTRKVFNFLPDSLYDNIETDRMGNPLTRPGLCAKQSCTPLNDDSKGNIVGIQGHMWTETVRTRNSRIRCCFLESSPWLRGRGIGPRGRMQRQRKIETRCGRRTGRGSRTHLDLRSWRVSMQLGSPIASLLLAPVLLPCLRVTADGELEVNVGLPGSTVECSVDGGETWVACPSKILLRTKSADGHRVSRVVPLTHTASIEGTKPPERPTPTEGTKTTDGTETRKRPSDGASSLTVTVACLWLGLLAASLAKQ